MLSSYNTVKDPSRDHHKQLIDHRMATADLHDPSSLNTDTPSTHHLPFFSPRPVHHDFGHIIPNSQIKSPTASTFSSRTHRERLNDPTASGLDLDDDPRSSVASDTYDDDTQLDDGDNDPSRRMSYLGPRMRFHSRAPWEMDREIYQDEDQQSDRSNLLSTTRKSFGISSPRSGNTRRPSGESTRSQPKQSFETTSSNLSYPRGALYALAQENLSTSSLVASAPGQKPFRGKFSLSRIRSESPNSSLISSPVSVNRSPESAYLDHHNTADIYTSPSQRQETYDNASVHPYANPDLVISFEHQTRNVSPDESVTHSGSVSTVTDSTLPSPLLRSGTNSTLSPATAVTSTPVTITKSRASTVQGKGISSPITNHGWEVYSHLKEDHPGPPQQPGVDNLPGWVDRVRTPAFSLISLEEARAQRMRNTAIQSSVAHQMPSSPPTSSSDLSPDASFDYDKKPGSTDHSSPLPRRTRARSISAGAKARSALQTLVGGGQLGTDHQEPDPMPLVSTGKILKHRKSGFMRIFNASRGQEKEDKLQQPPMPPSSDAHTAPNVQATPKVSKSTTHRVPVPELAIPLSESSSFAEVSTPLDLPSSNKSSPTPKRHNPPLSINTTRTQSYTKATTTMAGDAPSPKIQGMATLAPSRPWLLSLASKSAPANVSEFPSLKLRPVSTVFSAHFEDHMVPGNSRPSLETDVGTPSSSTKVLSPVTPGSASRPDPSSNDNLPPAVVTTISENQSSIVNSLQDQISASKLAWQRQIWELEGQVRDLKIQLETLRKTENDRGYCEACGRGQSLSSAASSLQDTKNSSVINRPRARTGTAARFGSAV